MVITHYGSSGLIDLYEIKIDLYEIKLEQMSP